MAFTVYQTPTAVSPATLPLVGTSDAVFYTVNESDAPTLAQPQFSYRLDLYLAATLQYTVLSGVNAASCGVFQIERLLKDYAKWDELTTANASIHTLLVGQSNTNAVGVLDVKLGWQYQNASGGFTVSLPVSNLLYFWRGSMVPLNFPTNSSQLLTYQPSTLQRKLLSVSQTHYVNENDYGVFAFFTNLSGTTSGQIPYFRVRYYDEAGTLLSDSFLSNAAAAPSAYQDRMVYFLCGPLNLKSQTLNTAASPAAVANAGWSYYTIDGWSSGSGGTQRCATYTFHRLVDCKYDTYRLAFINHLGGWDYLTFDKKSTRTTSVEKTSYTSYGSNAYNAGSSGQVVYPWSGGVESFAGSSKEQLTLNTGFRDESQNDLMKDLLNSPKVYLQEENWLPVRIVDSSVTYQTSVNDKLIQYSVQIEYGKDNPSLL